MPCSAREFWGSEGRWPLHVHRRAAGAVWTATCCSLMWSVTPVAGGPRATWRSVLASGGAVEQWCTTHAASLTGGACSVVIVKLSVRAARLACIPPPAHAIGWRCGVYIYNIKCFSDIAFCLKPHRPTPVSPLLSDQWENYPLSEGRPILVEFETVSIERAAVLAAPAGFIDVACSMPMPQRGASLM